jgi:hypothetical protein
MLRKWVTLSAATLLGTLSCVSAVQAAPKPLTGVNAAGQTIDSGWTWDTSAAVEPLVNLVFIRTEGNQFFFEKDAEFKNISDPIVITFNRVGASASNLVINDEAVLNSTGQAWGGFRMELSAGATGGVPNFVFTTSNGAPGIGDFNIKPFTNFTFYNANSGLLLNGGSVAPGATWFPGSQSNSGLALMANANDNSFSLKEIAIPIPLPAAAWTGLTGLLGLGLVGALKHARRRMA